MGITVEQIATSLSAKAEGDVSIEVNGASEPKDATAETLALAMSPKYADAIGEGQARVALLWEGADWRGMGLEAAVFVTRPRLAMAGLTQAFDAGPELPAGRHPTAVIDPSADIPDDAAIGPFVTIARGARLGKRARIASHASIGANTVLGDDALVLSGARIGARVHAGDRLIVQPGAVVGADGFSFVTPETSGVEASRAALGQAEVAAQKWHRIHSLGSVEIGDDVEIGANATIDRGTIRATKIGHGTKLDNLVHLGHNVEVGEDCLLCGQVGVAGSVRIGNHVVLGGQVGVSDNISIGDGVVAGGGSKILSNVPAGRAILGYPAVKMESQVESYKALRRLPRLFRDVAALKKAVPKDTRDD